MHVNEKTRACRCGTNYASAAAVFVSEHPGETVFRPLSPYTAGGGPVAAAREPPAWLSFASQFGLRKQKTTGNFAGSSSSFLINGVIVLW